MMPARFAQTNLGAVGFHREITLLDGATVELPKIRRQSFQQEFPFDLTRDFAVARLKMAGHNQFLAVAFRARKPQPCAFPVAAVVSAAICAVASIDDAGLLSIRRRYR